LPCSMSEGYMDEAGEWHELEWNSDDFRVPAKATQSDSPVEFGDKIAVRSGRSWPRKRNRPRSSPQLAPKAQWRRVGTARKGDSRALGVEADARREDLGVLKLRVVANTAPPAGGPYPRLRPISRTLGKATLLDLLVYFEVRPSVARIIVRGGVAKRPTALPGGVAQSPHLRKNPG
jgi:hypothetical protein